MTLLKFEWVVSFSMFCSVNEWKVNWILRAKVGKPVGKKMEGGGVGAAAASILDTDLFAHKNSNLLPKRLLGTFFSLRFLT